MSDFAQDVPRDYRYGRVPPIPKRAVWEWMKAKGLIMDTDQYATEADSGRTERHATHHNVTRLHDIEVAFDGRVFRITEEFGYLNGMMLYLAKRARNGDAAARETLTTFGVEIEDADGVTYWPVGE